MTKFYLIGKIMRIILASLFSLLLANCASYDFSHQVVQQGNLLPQEKIDRLKIGMSKEETAILMGSSLLSPTFNNNRWDYAYTWRKGNGPMKKRSVSLLFVHDHLAKIDYKP
jgi:outer membrane protein assembly factor BamE